MNKTKSAFIFGFAIFAGFFGAGNLILPPFLGFQSGQDWSWSAVGFILSGTLIPLLALFGHSKLQGTMLDFGNKVSTKFSLVLCVLIYTIAIALPCPRTAAVAHEMVIGPIFGSTPLLTSLIYFFLVLIFALNRGKAIDILGKYLTPIISLILFALIVMALGFTGKDLGPGIYESPMISGFLEGYQTYDAIAGLLMGGILVISIKNSQKGMEASGYQRMIAASGLVAMLCLFLIYVGLIYAGSQMAGQIEPEISRTNLLKAVAEFYLGRMGSSSLSLLVALACFTTAVAIVVGTGDFFKGLFKESARVYKMTVLICCALGVLIGQLNVDYIIQVAIPVLLFIYPITIVLIILNLFPERLASKTVFRSVVLVAFIFSIPDFFQFVIPGASLEFIHATLPFSKAGLGWVLPSLLTFLLVNGALQIKKNQEV